MYSYIKRLLDSEEGGFLIGSRRSGKTTAITQIIKKYEGSNILLVGPQRKHCQEILNRIKEEDLIKASSLKNIHIGSDRAASNIRGQTADVAIIEEAAYINDELFKNALFSIVPTNGILYALGTPREVTYKWDKNEDKWICNNIFKRMIDMGPRGVCIHTGPVLSKSELIEVTKYHTEDQIKTEFLGEWVCKYEY